MFHFKTYRLFYFSSFCLSLKGIAMFPHANVYQSSIYKPANEAKQAVDGNHATFAKTKEDSNQSWTVTFSKLRKISWMKMRIKGGKYNVYIERETDKRLCHSLDLPVQNSVYEPSFTCSTELSGDAINVMKMEYGALQLYEFYVCPENTYGSECTQCNEMCDSCHVTSGECTSCNGSWYGNKCNHMCPERCSNNTCEKETGYCFGCQGNFTGNKCQDERARDIWISDNDFTTNILAVAIPAALLMVVLLIVLKFRKYIRCHKSVRNNNKRLIFGSGEILSPNEMSSQISVFVPNDQSGVINSPHDGVVQMVVQYYNLEGNNLSVEDFVKDVKEKKKKESFKSEFQSLPNGLMGLYSEALNPKNTIRNRYKNIYPYDSCRVKLETDETKEGMSDYINACFVHGVHRDNAYIAAQGPFTAETIITFWKMIWEQKSKRVVMLTNLKEGQTVKCLQYWPEESETYGPFLIIAQSFDVFENYIIRKFVIRKGDDTKRVTHYHYTGWPDTRAPQSLENLLHFRNAVKNKLPANEGPLIIHSGAGIGRSGTFIALDYLLEYGFKEGNIDVKSYILTLRQQRAYSVQSLDQYIFLHEALVQGLTNLSLNCALHMVDEM